MRNRLSLVFTFVLVTLFANVVIFTTFSSTPVFAAETSTELSEERRGLISQNCGTLRQSLKQLQRSDSRARTYFGAIYETVSSKFLTPLNLRLVKNNLSSVSLIEVQTSLAEERKTFAADFIDYSKSLEELISIDCRLEPDQFYAKLLSTRKKRAIVDADLSSLNDLLVSVYKQTEKLKDSLKNAQEF